jgi:hypothetical protein
MTYTESIPVAKSLAEKALSRGFDVEAFLILTLLKDDVPNSEVDNKIQDMYNLFLLYVENHSIESLNAFLSVNYKMLEELYHSTYNKEEKELFKEYLTKITMLGSG